MIRKGNAREGFQETLNFSCDVSNYYKFSSKSEKFNHANYNKKLFIFAY